MIIDEIMVVQKQDMQKHVRILEITCIHQDEEDSFTVLQFFDSREVIRNLLWTLVRCVKVECTRTYHREFEYNRRH